MPLQVEPQDRTTLPSSAIHKGAGVAEQGIGDEDDLLIESFRLNEELVGILDTATKQRKFSLDSSYKQVSASFFAKACKTHEAITLLGKNRFGEDAAILVRSLLNLVINARWISQAPEERVPAYIDYASVSKAKLDSLVKSLCRSN